MKNYDSLYIDILRIGQCRLANGLSYNELKIELQKEGYDFKNDCIELAVKQWFFDCFHHRGNDQLPYDNISDLEDHLDCSFILKGNSCLVLVEHRTASKNLNIAWIALAISVSAILYAIIHDWIKDTGVLPPVQQPVIIERKKDSIVNLQSYSIDTGRIVQSR